jgi:hypothetical protein
LNSLISEAKSHDGHSIEVTHLHWSRFLLFHPLEYQQEWLLHLQCHQALVFLLVVTAFSIFNLSTTRCILPSSTLVLHRCDDFLF